jgi:hypothetical protein
MTFFGVLFWMGVLCLAPICAAIAYDAVKTDRRVPRSSALNSVAQGAQPKPAA